MARSRRIQIPGGFHHITARGNNRDPLFIDDGDRRTFFHVLGEAAAQHRCSVHAFCLMTNHLHLVIEDPRAELSTCLQKLNSRYAQRFNRRHQRTGHVFEGRFWNSVLDTDSYLTTAVEYVHRNPLDAGMVDHLPAYRWSSYPVYLGHRRRPTFLTTSTILESYGRDVDLLRVRTEQAHRDPRKDQALSNPLPASVLGSDAFKRRVASQSQAIAPEGADHGDDLAKRVPIADIVAITADTFERPADALVHSVRGRPNRARSAAIHLAHVHAGWPFGSIGDFFGISGSAASMTNSRFHDVLTVETDTMAKVARVVDRLIAAQLEHVGV